MPDMNLKNYQNKINSLISRAQENAVKPQADKLLAFISLIESIIFPIPVDPLLAGLTLAAPHKTFRFALVCTIGSVVGGIVGWLLGFLMGPSIESIFMHIPWFTEEKFIAVKDAYKQNGMLIIFLGAFTPLPYKVITITSGVAGVNIFTFILIYNFPYIQKSSAKTTFKGGVITQSKSLHTKTPKQRTDLIYELKSFVLDNLNKYLTFNINQNSLINAINNKLNYG